MNVSISGSVNDATIVTGSNNTLSDSNHGGCNTVKIASVTDELVNYTNGQGLPLRTFYDYAGCVPNVGSEWLVCVDDKGQVTSIG